jgi:hypothetical protein
MPEPADISRSRLRQLDELLSQLEDLNLREISYIPVRVGSALQEFGIEDPYQWSVSELLDMVFEQQELVLASIRTQSTIRRIRSRIVRKR